MSEKKYGKYWEAFYEKTYVKGAGKALWEVPASESVGQDFLAFSAVFDRDLPVLDIGCGTGAQARYLASHFPRVLGIDAAKTAVQLALEAGNPPNLDFWTADASDEQDCLRISASYGDLNIYMRGVLHQIDANSQEAFVRNLSKLMGQRGALYFVEVANHIRAYFAEEGNGSGYHELPRLVQEVFVSNLPPAGICLEDVPRLFPASQFDVLQAGNTSLATNLHLPSGKNIRIPAVYSLIKPVKSKL
jgi:SAM-dependent methyltransferase